MPATDAPKIAQGEPVALVLGSGGARGFAQIGVIGALQARGLRIVAIAGASSGALVGGICAAGRLQDFSDHLVRMSRGDFIRMLDPDPLGQPGMFRGERLVSAMREVVGDPEIETLPIDFTASAVDLLRQREVWIRKGRLWDAIRASIAIPGLLTPHVVNHRPLVDGGLLSPLPIAATRLSDAHRLIAVDMHGWPRHPAGEPAGGDDGGARRNGRFGAWVRGKLGERMRDERGHAMGLTEVMSRSLDLMQAQISRVQIALDPPELVIAIPRDAAQFYEFWRAAELIEIGRTEADKALDAAGY